jgi:hypothetical protein
MTTYDSTNKGRLSKNDRKEQPGHADYRGSINCRDAHACHK